MYEHSCVPIKHFYEHKFEFHVIYSDRIPSFKIFFNQF